LQKTVTILFEVILQMAAARLPLILLALAFPIHQSVESQLSTFDSPMVGLANSYRSKQFDLLGRRDEL
jgi:hypothetical protein